MAFKKARAWADDNVNLVVVIVMPLSFAAAIYVMIGLSWAPAGSEKVKVVSNDRFE